MSLDQTTAQVVERLPLPPDGGLTLVCIDGMSAAGKSTIALSVARACPGRATVIHADDFYGPEQGDWRAWSPQQGYQRYFDHERLARQLLQPLSRGVTGRFQRYDWLTKELAQWVAVEPTGVVLIEGVYLLRPRLRPFWDLSVYVDTPREIRLARVSERRENDAGWIARWMAAEDFYRAADHPAQASDFIVEGY